MSTKPIRGLNARQAAVAAKAIGSEKWDADNIPVNARCRKCGGDLRAAPALLAAIRQNVVDHAECGGTFRALTTEASDG